MNAFAGCRFRSASKHASLAARLRPAFTLVECLVAVSILGILVALILPAVQSARESARRIQCASNLKQLGIALQTYYSENNMFPPGVRTKSGRSGTFEYGNISVFVSILPQIEQRVLFDCVNFDLALYDTAGTPLVENQTVRRASVALFLCPSDGEVNHRVNYRFNRGVWQQNAQDYGPFAPFFISTQASISDGLSRTAFMSERVGGDFIQGSQDAKRNFVYSTQIDTASMKIEDDFVAPCLSSADRVWLPFTGRYWFYNGDPFTYYHHLGRPNDDRPSCFSHYERHWGILGFAPPRSNHAGSVNVLYGDGHVEPILDSIDPRLWRALGTPRGGE